MLTRMLWIAALASASVTAQDATAPGSVRWLYCSFESHGSAFRLNSGRMEARIKVCMMTAEGCRYEDVLVSESARSERESTVQGCAIAQSARAKVLSTLGAQGWELVSVLRHDREDGSPATMTFFLKRRVE